MAEPVSRITIVGGGTAGWLTALLLYSSRDRLGDGEAPPTIELIESPNVPTVGVGEATVPNMPNTLRAGGLSEREFVKTCNASFKLGVHFGHWNVDNDGNFIDFINPFSFAATLKGTQAAYHYLAHGDRQLGYGRFFTPAFDLAESFKGPRQLGEPEFARMPSYAYHLDAGKFAALMRDVCVARGVVHIRDDVVDVDLDEQGFVSALQLKERGRHEVELIIDCTGFKGLIINQVLKEPFVSYSRYLANDRALAVQIPHPDPTRILPMTKSTALGAGWVWRVPLFNRIGTGYVFSSAHRTDEEAIEEFLAHLGEAGEGAEPRVIPMRVGRTRTAWVKNCVAIGLSGGFIEPLESTAIHMIDVSVRWLLSYFPDRSFAGALRSRYNQLVESLYSEVRDFICLHYALGNRTDSQYWIDAREELEVPDSLARNIELWRHKLPTQTDLEFSSLFTATTYQAVLLGKGVYDTGYGKDTIGRNMAVRKDRWEEAAGKTRGEIRNFVSNMADHYTLLQELRGELSQSASLAPPARAPGPSVRDAGPDAASLL